VNFFQGAPPSISGMTSAIWGLFVFAILKQWKLYLVNPYHKSE
jgi:hypothetical protein